MTDTTTEQSGGNVSKVRGQKTRELFLEGLAEHGTISKACMIAGVTRSAYDKWRQRIPDFAERSDAVRERALREGGSEDWDGSLSLIHI